MMSQVFILICIVEVIRLSDSLINCTRIALQVELVFGMGYVLLDYVMMQGKLGPHSWHFVYRALLSADTVHLKNRDVFEDNNFKARPTVFKAFGVSRVRIRVNVRVYSQILG